MKFFAASLASAFLTLASIEGPCAAGSVNYQIDVAHSGAISFSGIFKPPLKRRWVHDLGGPVSYPIVAGGMVFVTAGDPDEENADLYALNMSNGEVVWSKKLSSSLMWANAAYDNNRIFVLDGSGTLQAFSADASGRLLWSVTSAGSEAPPLAGAGLVYTSAGQDVLAFDETTGAKRWDASINTGRTSPLALGGGGLYYTPSSEYIRFDPATGAKIWDDLICCLGPGLSAVYHDGFLYVRDLHNSDVVLDAPTGAFVDALGAINQPPAFWDYSGGQNLEYTLFDGALYAVDLATGNVAWRYRGDGKLASAPIVMNGTVVEGSQSGKLYLLNGQTGKRLWSHNVGAPIAQAVQGPLTGLGADNGVLLVPAGNQLSVYVPKQ